MKKNYFRLLFFYTVIIFFLGIGFLPAEEAGVGQSAADIIEKTIKKEGIKAAKQLFAKMRQAPEGTYSFIENEFIKLTNQLKKVKKSAEAFELLKLCESVFADSPRLLYNLALAHKENGDQQSFYRYIRKTHTSRQKLHLEQFLKKNQDNLLTTADSVIQKHLESTGGIKAWENVKTLKIQLYLHGTFGKGEILERYYKRPSFFRQGMEGKGSFITTDGKKVWSVNNGVWKEIEGKPYKRTASVDDFFINYQDKGVNYDFMGVEILTYAPVYHLKRTFWDKYQEDLYFSIKAGYLTEKLTPYNLGPSFFTMWDYGQFGEIWIPRVRMRLVGDFGPPHGGIVKEVKINIPLDDSLFIKKNQ